MKKYILLLSMLVTALLVITYTSCSDLLDQQPQGEWVDGDNSGGSFDADIFALYSKARSYHVVSGNTAMAFHFFRSEDAEVGSTVSDNSAYVSSFDEFNYNASDGALQEYWTNNYQIVHSANRLIDTMQYLVSNGGELTPGDLINKYEAHMFRAYAYFNLVRGFGEIPLIDFKISDAAEANIPKSPVSDIYVLIDKDLTEAEKLPTTWETRFIGRFTYGAARALHAKTYMQRNDWGSMYTAAKDVMALTAIYSLDTPFERIFREEGENTSESVLELQCTARAGVTINEYGSQFAQVQGVRGSGDWNFGWGWHTPTQILADAFEPGDPRKDETLLYFARSAAEAATMTPNKPYNEIPIVTDAVVNLYYNKKVYTNPAKRAEYGAKDGGWVNIRLIRYADVVLMAAEAANELGYTEEARDLLEEVRARARGTNASVLPYRNTTDQTELRDYIRHERRIELAMEFDRFYDLVRWGTARTVLHAAGKTGYQDRHRYFPLPQSEIDKSNGVLIQNPEY